jgi:tetratricopeptide (TPR) repeat protein
MGRAFSEILSGELEGSPQRYVIQWRGLHSFDAPLGKRSAAPGISAEPTEALAAGANQILYGYFSVVNGMLRVTAVQEDGATRKMVLVISASVPVGDGIFPVAEALARQLGPAHPFGTRNVSALCDYVEALESPDPTTAMRSFAEAATADPDFGRAYVMWLDAALAQRNGAEAERAIAQSRAHAGRFTAMDRARLDLGAAALHGDFKARQQALETLASLDPADPNNHRALAQTLMSTRHYDGAIVEFRRALTLRPEDPLALNSMGYAAAFSGDLPTAIRVLRGYEQLRPNEPNPLDSLGDVHFALGHYSEAEQFYLAAHAKDPAFLNGGELLKAAQARLMTGDIGGATALFNRYLAERQAAHDPFAEYHAAAWSWRTGQRRAGLQRLDRLARAEEAGPRREIASGADAQLVIWLLELGDRAGAAEHARKAVVEAVPATSGVAALAAFLADPEASPEPSQSPFKDYARAYAPLFAKDVPAATQALEEMFQRPTNDLDDGLGVLLAWAYEVAGQWQKAEVLLRLNPLPQAAGLPLFSSLYFPRLFFLRGAVLDKEGQRREASRNYQLFLSLSGPDAEMWGEEHRARP